MVAAYEIYLQSTEWLDKRRRVLARAKSMCEGCGIRNAVQAHHLSYPAAVLPGSKEWIGAEKLFHLVALCLRCHQDLNSSKAREVAGLGATGTRGQLHPPALHRQVADLRIADSQNLANANLLSKVTGSFVPFTDFAGCSTDKHGNRRHKIGAARVPASGT